MTRTPAAAARRRPGVRAPERGSATAELVLVAPVLVLLLLFLVYATRATGSRMRVADAAHQAARAASLARTPAQAVADAQAVAGAALADAGVTCQQLAVDTDTRGLAPGAAVRVTVSCTVGLDDLALLGVPGTATLEGTSTSPVDRFGDVSPEFVSPAFANSDAGTAP